MTNLHRQLGFVTLFGICCLATKRLMSKYLSMQKRVVVTTGWGNMDPGTGKYIPLVYQVTLMKLIEFHSIMPSCEPQLTPSNYKTTCLTIQCIIMNNDFIIILLFIEIVFLGCLVTHVKNKHFIGNSKAKLSLSCTSSKLITWE